MAQVNVLQVCNQLGMGGAEKTLQIFSKYLNSDVFRVYVSALSKGGEREKILRNMGFEVHVVGNHQRRLVDLMRAKQIHVLHVHRAGSEEPLSILAAKDAGVPVIVETKVFGLVDDSYSGKLVDRRLFVSKMCAIRYQHWTGMSNREFHKTSSVLYNPIDPEEFETHMLLQRDVDKAKESLGIPVDAPVIGRIGRPDPRKWSDFCIRMMPHLIRRIADVRYIVMGIPQAKKLEISRRGLTHHFIFRESSPDPAQVVQFYSLIDVLAHSSRTGESFGLSIAEAMAAGRPVVVNSTPMRDNAQVELVDNGKTGFVANSPRAYAEAVAYLLRNKEIAQRMGLAGRQKAAQDYHAPELALMLEKLYLQLLRSKGVQVDDAIMARYDDVQQVPSENDVGAFREEYQQRLTTCWGRPNYANILGYRYLTSNYLAFNAAKKVHDLLMGLRSPHAA